MELTVQILQNPNESVDETMKSLDGLPVRVTKFNYGLDRSKLINDSAAKSNTDWQLYLDSSEVVVSGLDNLQLATSHIQLLQGEILTKPIRIWNKNQHKFKNPVFETIEGESVFCDMIIYKKKNDVETGLETWKKTKNLSVDYYYYQALTNLKHKKTKEFLNLAEYYLFNSKDIIKSTMLIYYMAFINQDINNLIFCLSNHILMAEFWCLLGDISFKNNQFMKAIAFYQNAMILGGRRLKEDKWPMHITKYKEYPEKIINEIKEIQNKSSSFTTTVT